MDQLCALIREAGQWRATAMCRAIACLAVTGRAAFHHMRCKPVLGLMVRVFGARARLDNRAAGNRNRNDKAEDMGNDSAFHLEASIERQSAFRQRP